VSQGNNPSRFPRGLPGTPGIPPGKVATLGEVITFVVEEGALLTKVSAGFGGICYIQEGKGREKSQP
jgi:hypothetical protein